MRRPQYRQFLLVAAVTREFAGLPQPDISMRPKRMKTDIS
ncbi:hypothetical protein AS9A_P20018 (plasmid) [Hoyosella subflava DQS3-9A1]|uniref:Uncharacterized protein n=1 Tax=Hoyosella subflava (strain DSM 45089 / JCM 17490 / NBRC 109087 / DQS3-9A1) TaxID=443218 RepID=F6ESE1_HOYSD|nr:hypothetical protein AS9A_P20018 [Hoyosella subflava DQS3-9A1]